MARGVNMIGVDPILPRSKYRNFDGGHIDSAPVV
jgi:hypothetical protein